MSTTDALGIVGVVSVLGAYLLLQLGRLRPEHPGFSLANAVGAALILVSLSQDFNLPATLIEVAWLLISLIGLGRTLSARRRPR